MHHCFFLGGFEGQLPIFFLGGDVVVGGWESTKKHQQSTTTPTTTPKFQVFNYHKPTKPILPKESQRPPRFSRYHKLPELFNQRAQLDQQRRSNEAMEAEESRRQQRKLREEKEKEREKADDEEQQRNVCWEFAGV